MICREIGGFRMWLDPKRGGLSSILKKKSIREHCFMWILNKEVEGELALDVGANIGYTTLPICAKAERVLAFEPDPRSIDLLSKNIKENEFSHKTKVYDCAASDKIGLRTISLASRPNQTSFRFNQKGKMGERVVEIITIDSLNILPNFIKMDVEGHEVEVLRGSMKSLEKVKKCKILIEVHPQFFEGDSFELVLRQLINIGFKFKYVVSAGVIRPTLFKKAGYEPMSNTPIVGGNNNKGNKRAIYDCVSTEHAINWSSYKHVQKRPNSSPSPKIVRSILLVKG